MIDLRQPYCERSVATKCHKKELIDILFCILYTFRVETYLKE